MDNLKSNYKIVDDTPEKSGFICHHKDHAPPMLMLVIPAGKVLEWTCPSCGHVTRVRGYSVTSQGLVPNAVKGNGKCPNEGHPCFCTGACRKDGFQ